MEVICINDSFPTESIARIPNRPVRDKIYHFRDVILYPNKTKGVLLEEIINPHLSHPTGLGTFEPTFNINRFANLDMTIISQEQVDHYIEELTAALDEHYELSKYD